MGCSVKEVGWAFGHGPFSYSDGNLERYMMQGPGKKIYEGFDISCILIQMKISDCWTIWIKMERQQPWVTKMER